MTRKPTRPANTLRYTLYPVLLAVVLVSLMGCGLTGSSKTSAPPSPSGVLSPSQSSLSFGQQAVGGSGATLPLTITNTGNAQASIQSISCSNPAFTYTGPSLPATLAASQSVQLNVSFDPKAPGSYTAQLTIQGTAQNLPMSIPLSGTGTAPIISLSPASINFGNQTVNTTSGSQTVTVSNTGQLAMSVSQVGVSPSQFAATGPTPPYTVSPGNSVAYAVTFTPSGAQSYSGTLSIASNAYNGTGSTSLSGIGVLATTVLNVSPTSLNFGNQLINTVSAPQIVTLTNAGSTPITISAVSATPPFAVTGFPGSTVLAPGQSLPLSVTFAPTSATSYSGTLTITSTAPSSPNIVSLSGTGITQSSTNLTPPICGLTNDITQHIPNATAWRTFSAPAVGSTYTDPLYGCLVYRLTNANVDTCDGPAGTSGETGHYALDEAINADDTLFMVSCIQWGGYRIVHIPDGAEVVSSANFPNGLKNSLVEWDRTDPNTFWFTSSNNLYKGVINRVSGTVTSTIVHTFSEYAGGAVSMADHATMNANGYLPIEGQATIGGTYDIFLYNPATNTKLNAYRTTCTGSLPGGQPGCTHSIHATPNNGIEIGFLSSPQNDLTPPTPGEAGCQGGSTANESGARLWESPFTIPMPDIDPCTNHDAVGLDLSGNEIVVSEALKNWEQSGRGPFGNCSNGYSPLGMNFSSLGSLPFCVFNTIWLVAGWDVSWLDSSSSFWALYSKQHESSAECFNSGGCGYSDPSPSNWGQYTNEIVLVRPDANNDPTKIYRLTLSHSRQEESFFADARAGISFDGKWVFFSSNAAWGQTGCGSVNYCDDVYLIRIH